MNEKTMKSKTAWFLLYHVYRWYKRELKRTHSAQCFIDFVDFLASIEDATTRNSLPQVYHSRRGYETRVVRELVYRSK